MFFLVFVNRLLLWEVDKFGFGFNRLGDYWSGYVCMYMKFWKNGFFFLCILFIK